MFIRASMLPITKYKRQLEQLGLEQDLHRYLLSSAAFRNVRLKNLFHKTLLGSLE